MGEGLRIAPNNPPSHEASADEEPLAISANKHRLIQVRRVGRRKLFDRARKELWLEWFAATCNLWLSAEKAGVHEKTVSRHLLNDAAFFEAAQRALQLGYFRLEARSLQEAHKLRFGQSGPARSHDSPDHALRGGLAEGPLHHPSDGPPPPADQVGRGEDYKVRILDSREGEEHFDPALAMQLLRENKRGDPGSREKRKAGRSSATAATNKEIAEALAKRLKGFALRVERKED
jgi:hypothetical protein